MTTLPTPPGVCLDQPRPGRRVLFASAHSILDPSSGAAVATLDVLQGLAAAGFDCQAFCTTKLDFHHEVGFEKILGALREPYQVRPAVCGTDRVQVLNTRRRRVPITLVRLASSRITEQPIADVRGVLELFRQFLEDARPDVLLTYGGDPISDGMIILARRRGIPVVFALHNLGYSDRRPFAKVDSCIVPSEFARRFYRDRVGLECHVLPNPVDWERVWVDGPGAEGRWRHAGGPGCGETCGPVVGGVGRPAPNREAVAGVGRPAPHVGGRRFVTFVNPAPEKGAVVFVRIAHELGRRRPEIPFLVVESRGDRGHLAACGLGRDQPVNVHLMANTTDPRRFWAVTQLVVLPSVCWENQPLVAIEAMINGIPVLGADRGGIPEVLGESGVLLPLPAHLTPVSQVLPTAEEVEPWIETIIRLWDDPALYEERSRKAREEAQRWHLDRLRPLYAEFFGNIRVQGRPPFVVREIGGNGIVGAFGPRAATPAAPGASPPLTPPALTDRHVHAEPAEGFPGVAALWTGSRGVARPLIRPSGTFSPRGEGDGAGRDTAPHPPFGHLLPEGEGDGARPRPADRPAQRRKTDGSRVGELRPHADRPVNLRERAPRVSLADAEGPADPAETIPLSFVVCVSDEAILAANLLASPCLAPEAPHEVIGVLKAPSAAAGLHAGLERARNDWVVLVHQDVVLPPGWDRRIMRQLRQAEHTIGPIGVAGVYGVGPVRESPGRLLAAERIGRVVDRGRLLRDGPDLPARAATLDELLLIVRRDTPLRADPALGFHLYGADLCLQARQRGLAVVVLEALCQHNSRSLALPESFFASAAVFACKWAEWLPIVTPCVVFDHAGQMSLLGNASQDGPSIATAEGRPLLPAQGFVPTPHRGTPVVSLP